MRAISFALRPNVLLKTIMAVTGLIVALVAAPGWAASYNPTSSDAKENTAGGSSSLTTLHGTDNSAFGFKALLSNSTGGSYNTATGAYALGSNYDGGSNTADGVSALYSNVSGSDNTALGAGAMTNNTDASDNTAVGWFALASNKLG